MVSGVRDPFPAAGVGYYAEGAKLVAALLNGEERGHAADVAARRRERIELLLGCKVG